MNCVISLNYHWIIGLMKCVCQDGTWDTIKWSLTFVRDLTDVCLYSYFSMMDDLRKQDPPGGRIEIRFDTFRS